MYKSGTSGNPITLKAYPGEFPIIDGTGTATGTSQALVSMGGNYNVIDGFEIRNFQPATALTWDGDLYLVQAFTSNYNTIKNCNIHDCWGCGVQLMGTGHVLEDSQVHDVAQYSITYGNSPGASWPGAITIGVAFSNTWGVATNCTVRRVKSYRNGGEGVLPMNSSYTTVEDCEIYDNWSVNLHCTDSDHCVIQRNKIYATTNGDALWGANLAARGINLSNEYTTPNHNVNGGTYNTIVNNIIYNTGEPFSVWSYYATECSNNVVAYNTFVDGRTNGKGAGPQMLRWGWAGGGTVTNNVFSNNVIDSTVAGVSSLAGTPGTGWTFTRNIWRLSPSGLTLDGNSIVQNPNLTRAGATGAGTLVDEFFRPLVGSWCIGAGAALASVTVDKQQVTRPGSPTVGALEGVSAGDWTTIPSPLTGTDVGSPSPTGSKQYSPSLNQYRIISYNSLDIYSTSDQFGYIYLSASDEWELVYKVESYSGGGTYAKFGCVLRTSLTANSGSLGFLINPNYGTTQVPWRGSDGASTLILLEYATLDRWHKVSRSIGGAVAFSTSTDGVTWIYRSTLSNTVVGTSPLYLGLAVCAQSASLTATGIFSNVSFYNAAEAVGTITADAEVLGVTENAEIQQAAGVISVDAELLGYSESRDISEATGTILADFDLVGVALNDGDEFMATAQDIIRSALLLNGAVAADQTLSQTDLDDGLVTLNNMIESWSLDGTVVYSVTQYTTPTTAGVDSVVLTTRPLKILAARITDTAGIDHAIAEVGWDDYSIISNKAVQSAFPLVFWCDYAFPAPTVKFWPVPTYAYTLTFMVHLPFYGFDALDSTVVFPPGFERALRYNLAVEMAQYGGALPPKVEDIARESLMLLKVTNSRQTTLQNDSVFINRAGRTNIYSNIT
jgi:hypothetical protein